MELKQTGFVILGILAIHPNQSGYEIRKTVQQTVGFFWGESYGQIYPTLKRLLAEELIERSGKAPKTAREPQEYSITPAGQKCLNKWLAVPFSPHPPRDEFLLKMFFAESAGPQAAINQLRQFDQKNQAMLASIEELRELAVANSSRYPGFPYWLLTVDYGLTQLRGAREWSRKAALVLNDLEQQSNAAIPRKTEDQ